MRIESQGSKPVCHLATLAALTGTPLRDVVRFACKSAGIRTWNPTTKRNLRYPYKFWDASYATAMHFGGKAVADLMATKTTGASMPGSLVTNSVIPAAGRGIVIIRVGSWFGATHVSPWENGRVFDSNAPLAERFGGELLKTYLARYPGASVVTVKTLPEPERGAVGDAHPNPNPEDMGY